MLFKQSKISLSVH